ncbi:hypothetical protein ACLKA7_012517 [Drosophila subpalustris]
MKSFVHLFAFGFLLLNLIVALQAGLLIQRNGVVYCKLSTRRSCDKTTAYCVKITQAANPPPNTCKYYKNECKFLIDKCLSKTQYGREAAPTVATDCTTANIPVGFTGNC